MLALAVLAAGCWSESSTDGRSSEYTAALQEQFDDRIGELDTLDDDVLRCLAAEVVDSIGAQALASAGLTPTALRTRGVEVFRDLEEDIEELVDGFATQVGSCVDPREVLAESFARMPESSRRSCFIGGVNSRTAQHALAEQLLTGELGAADIQYFVDVAEACAG